MVAGVSTVLLISLQSENLYFYSVFFILLAISNGWIMGQSQIRLLLKSLAFAGLLSALLKVTGSYFQLFGNSFYSYLSLISLSAVPSLVLLGIQLIRAPDTPVLETKSKSSNVIFAAVAIALATSIIPQLDIFVLGKTLEKPIFENFVQATIFAKVVFFLFLMIAQWLLPQQIRNPSQFRWGAKAIFVPGVICLVFAFGLRIVSPYVSLYVMNWDPAPSPNFVFLSCLNMALLTWFYLLVQETCAQRKSFQAFCTMVGLLALGTIQYFLKLEIETYFYLCFGFLLAMNSGLTIFLSRQPSLKPST